MKNKKAFLVGLEREAFRIKKDGTIDSSPHPETLGNKLYHPYITTDFSESQLELITPPFSSNKEALLSLSEILSFIKSKKILIHNHSLPPSGKVRLAKFGPEGQEKEEYRRYLLDKYGSDMQAISGVHYNFSIPGLTCDEYMHIVRNTIRYGFIFPFLFGNSTSKDYPNATSIRCSSKGYFPKFQQELLIDFNSTEGYLSSIRDMPSLKSPREYYLFIRPKFKNGAVNHLELRCLDIDPAMETGISLETMEFTKDFFFKMLELPSPPLSGSQLLAYLAQFEDVALYGNSEKVLNNSSYSESPYGKTQSVEKTLSFLQLSPPETKTAPKTHASVPSYLEEATEASIIRSLQVSTRLLVASANEEGLDVTILDAATSTIRVSKGDFSQIISQATFTEKDSYISYQMQQDKTLTKKLLQETGLSTTSGTTYSSDEFDLAPYFGKKVCIKPAAANYGDGISILKTDNPVMLKEAVDLAFAHSTSILIEDFFTGEEYRFFVVDGKEVFICKRSPPTVTGDGRSTVKELVDEENKKRPRDFPIKLASNHDTIVEKGKTFLVRENSNVSTGGTAADTTDQVHESYKEIARKAAKRMKTFLCGVDILIKDIHQVARKENYAIVETNYNPALYLHQHPFFGGRNISKSIFKALGFVGISN